MVTFAENPCGSAVSRVKVKLFGLAFEALACLSNLTSAATLYAPSLQPYWTTDSSLHVSQFTASVTLNVLPLEILCSDFSFSFSVSHASSSCPSRLLRENIFYCLSALAAHLLLLNHHPTSVNTSLYMPTWNSSGCLHFTAILKERSSCFLALVFCTCLLWRGAAWKFGSNIMIELMSLGFCTS